MGNHPWYLFPYLDGYSSDRALSGLDGSSRMSQRIGRWLQNNKTKYSCYNINNDHRNMFCCLQGHKKLNSQLKVVHVVKLKSAWTKSSFLKQNIKSTKHKDACTCIYHWDFFKQSFLRIDGKELNLLTNTYKSPSTTIIVISYQIVVWVYSSLG